jgi:hypothetical protein
MVRSGGGEALLNCRNQWALFNGNMEHETQPIKLIKVFFNLKKNVFFPTVYIFFDMWKWCDNDMCTTAILTRFFLYLVTHSLYVQHIKHRCIS